MSRPKSAHFPRIPSPSPSAAFAQFHQRPTSSYAVLEPAVEPSLLPSEQYPSFGQSEDFQIEEAVVVNIRKSQPNILSKLHSYRALNHEAGFPPPRNLRTKISQVLGRGASQLSSKHQNIALSNPISPSSPVAPKLPPIFFDGCCDESTAVASDDEPRASGETLIDVYRFPTPPSAQDPLESLSMTAEELLGGIGHPGIAELPTTSHRDDLDDKRNTCNSGSSGSQSSKLSQFSGSSRTQFTRIARDAFQTALLQRDGPSNVSYEQGTAQEGLQTPQGTLFQSPEIES